MKKWEQMAMDVILFVCVLIITQNYVNGLTNNASAVVGNQATLPCKTDTAGASVMWFDPSSKLLTRNAEVVTDDRRISINNPYEREWNLLINNVRTSDEGKYKCMIILSSGQTTDKFVNLAILNSPTMLKSSEDVSVVTGNDVTIECEASGSPTPGISWYKHTLEAERELIASNQNQLTVQAITKEKAGVYECEADNGVPPKATETIKVDIQFPPLMTLPYQQINQPIGRDTLLDCLVTANPLSSHYWMKDGVRIVDSEKFKLYTWKFDQYTRRLGAFLMNLEESDFGSYVCVAENEYATVNETMQLSELVTGTVKIIKKPADVISKINHDVLIHCTVEGMTHRDNLIWWRHTTAGYQKLYESNPSSLKNTPNNNVNNQNNNGANPNNNGDSDSSDIRYNIDNSNNDGTKVSLDPDSDKDNSNPDGNIARDSNPGGKFEVKEHYNLLVKGVTVSDGGIYGCELVGSMNYTAQLTVVDNVTCHNNNSQIKQGDYMHIGCQLHFTGNHRNWDVSWQHGDRKLSSINHDSPGQLLRMVSFRSWVSDSGMYTCEVTSIQPDFHDSCQTEMFVDEPDDVTLPPIQIPTGAPSTGDKVQLSMMGIILGGALVAITVLLLVILGATVTYYKRELAKYKRAPSEPTDRSSCLVLGGLLVLFLKGLPVKMLLQNILGAEPMQSLQADLFDQQVWEWSHHQCGDAGTKQPSQTGQQYEHHSPGPRGIVNHVYEENEDYVRLDINRIHHLPAQFV